MVSGIGKVERKLESPTAILDASFPCVAQSVINPRHLIHDDHTLQIAFRPAVMITQAYAKRDILLAALLSTIALKSVHGASNELAWLQTERGKLLPATQKSHAAAHFKIGGSIKTNVAWYSKGHRASLCVTHRGPA